MKQSKVVRAVTQTQAQGAVAAVLKLKRLFTHKGSKIVVACMPKTGSTFLRHILMQATGFRSAQLNYAFERHEQDLYLPRLVDYYSLDTVTQIHLRASGPNLDLLRRFEIRPVVLVRNFFDVVPSVRDYLHKEGYERFPFLYATERLADLNESEQNSFIIKFALPWYFSFYVSWFEATRQGSAETLWLTHEELREDWSTGLAKVLQHCDIVVPKERLESAVEETLKLGKDRLRINRGVSGRGREELTEEQQREIHSMAALYPWVDFSPVGL